MLRGDLAQGGLVAALRAVTAEPGATGTLRLHGPEGAVAAVSLSGGRVHAVLTSDPQPDVETRLRTAGLVSRADLAEAEEGQQELVDWSVGELLVELGILSEEVLTAAAAELLADALDRVASWTAGRWSFLAGERTRELPGVALDVDAVTEQLQRRATALRAAWAVALGPEAVVSLADAGAAPADGAGAVTLDDAARTLLLAVDGERCVADLALSCGLSLLEAATVVGVLVAAGLADVQVGVDGDAHAPTREAAAPASAGDDGMAATLAALAAALSGSRPESTPRPERAAGGFVVGLRPEAGYDLVVGRDVAGLLPVEQPGDAETRRRRARADGPLEESGAEVEDPFAAALAKVSAALSSTLGDAIEPEPEDVVVQRVGPAADLPRDDGDPDARRRARLRRAAAAELADAFRDAADPGAVVDPLAPELLVPGVAAEREPAPVLHVAGTRNAEPEAAWAPVVDLAERRALREGDGAEAVEPSATEQDVAAERAELERAELERAEAERAEIERAATERAEIERAEAERAEVRRAAAAQAEAAERVVAERAEAGRAAAVQAAAERAAAERATAERSAAQRLEAERIDAQRAAAERAAAAEIAVKRAAARRAATERAEAERAEAERAEAERAEAERAEAE
ncbi:MAG: hypothetical protein JWM67_494, partial [Mycobacterium sp.]|nr:hypothetical protein [Mycobacterium sp.]